MRQTNFKVAHRYALNALTLLRKIAAIFAVSFAIAVLFMASPLYEEREDAFGVEVDTTSCTNFPIDYSLITYTNTFFIPYGGTSTGQFDYDYRYVWSNKFGVSLDASDFDENGNIISFTVTAQVYAQICDVPDDKELIIDMSECPESEYETMASRSSIRLYKSAPYNAANRYFTSALEVKPVNKIVSSKDTAPVLMYETDPIKVALPSGKYLTVGDTPIIQIGFSAMPTYMETDIDVATLISTSNVHFKVDNTPETLTFNPNQPASDAVGGTEIVGNLLEQGAGVAKTLEATPAVALKNVTGNAEILQNPPEPVDVRYTNEGGNWYYWRTDDDTGETEKKYATVRGVDGVMYWNDVWGYKDASGNVTETFKASDRDGNVDTASGKEIWNDSNLVWISGDVAPRCGANREYFYEYKEKEQAKAKKVWNAESDVNGEKVTFALQYSSDGGTTWTNTSQAVELDGTSDGAASDVAVGEVNPWEATFDITAALAEINAANSTSYTSDQLSWRALETPLNSENWLDEGEKTCAVVPYDAVSGAATATVNSITNTAAITLQGSKVWDDDDDTWETRKLLSSSDFTLTGQPGALSTAFTDVTDMTEAQAASVTGARFKWTSKPSLDSGTWTFEISNLAKYDGAGNKLTYFVEEKDASVPAGYTSITSDDGSTVTNELDTAEILVAKDKDGGYSKDDLDRDFSFNIKVGKDSASETKALTYRVLDDTLTWVEGKTDENGNFTLKAGYVAQFKLPLGYKYSIEETGLDDSWTTTYDANKDGAVSTTKDDSTSTIVKNVKKTGDLVFGKVVEGSTKGETFTFDIELENTSKPGLEAVVSNSAGVETNRVALSVDADGFKESATLTLGNGDSVKIEGVEVGTKYKITERSSEEFDSYVGSGVSDADKATTSANVFEGTIQDETNNHSINTGVFKNVKKKGALEVTKVNNDSVVQGHENDEFSFEVTVDGAAYANKTAKVLDENGKDTGATVTTDASGKLKIKGNQTARFDDIETGLSYEVKEVDLSVDYLTPGENNMSGTITHRGSAVAKYRATNTLLRKTLQITKSAIGASDLDEFSFELKTGTQGNESSFSGKYVISGSSHGKTAHTLGNGAAEMTVYGEERQTSDGVISGIKAGDTVTFELPVGLTYYVVSEKPVDAFAAVPSGEKTGSVNAGTNNAQEVFTNVKLPAQPAEVKLSLDKLFVFPNDKAQVMDAGKFSFTLDSDDVVIEVTRTITTTDGTFDFVTGDTGETAATKGVSGTYSSYADSDSAVGMTQQTATNDMSGLVEFAAVKVAKAGTFHFQINEVKGSDADVSIYNSSTVNVEVVTSVDDATNTVKVDSIKYTGADSSDDGSTGIMKNTKKPQLKIDNVTENQDDPSQGTNWGGTVTEGSEVDEKDTSTWQYDETGVSWKPAEKFHTESVVVKIYENGKDNNPTQTIEVPINSDGTYDLTELLKVFPNAKVTGDKNGESSLDLGELTCDTEIDVKFAKDVDPNTPTNPDNPDENKNGSLPSTGDWGGTAALYLFLVGITGAGLAFALRRSRR